MRLLSITLLLLAIAVSCFAQHTIHNQFRNDLHRLKLKGKVKAVTENEYNGKGDSLKLKSVSKFDTSGNEVEFFTYSSTGVIQSKTVFRYNDSGKLQEEVRYKADGTMNVRTTCKYDEKGNKIEEYNYDGSGTMFMKIVSKYDSKGNRLTKDSFNEFGALFLKCNSKYDEDGNEVSSREYDSHKSLKFSTTYDYEDYDKAGNWLKRTTYKNDEPASVTVREVEYR